MLVNKHSTMFMNGAKVPKSLGVHGGLTKLLSKKKSGFATRSPFEVINKPQKYIV